ncbi:two-component regulator propeller domain-containing protein [Mariniflexile ostreae]|uniref:histidine kinase n=1 Tax=Mariniflexile ostreae TaxID=1520892 RepID=A0ABV5FEP3_9FLAO
MKSPYIMFVLFFFCALSLKAQDNSSFLKNFQFINYSTKDGLSQRSVTSILQDSTGFMWFGTRYGLNKFDGNIFKNYNYNFEDINSLSNNWVTDVIKDENGTVWVGTKRGLNKYNPEKDNFSRVNQSNSIKPFYDHEIWDIKVQDSLFLWIATSEGLDKFNTKTNETLTFKHSIKNPNSISSNKINRLFIDSSKRLWVCTNDKIDLYDINKNTFKHYDYPNNASPLNTKNNSITLFQDSNGKIWLGYNNGLALLNHKNDCFEDFKFSTDLKIESSVRTILEDREGVLWIGSYDGLYRFDKKNNTIFKYQHDIINPKSLSQNSIYDIVEDTRGDLWIGSWAGGISYLDKNFNDFITFFEGFNNKNLNYNVVSSIVEDESNNLWIGTEGGGLNFYDKQKAEFTYFEHDPKNPNSLSDNNVKAIIQDKKGGFWVGTHGGGLNHITVNGKSKIFKNFKNLPYDLSTISDNKITTLIEDVNFNIWIGTNEGGLNFYDKAKNEFIRIKDTNKVLGHFIYKISKSENDNSLLVGGEAGLAKINIDTKKIVPIDFIKKSKSNLTLSPVISIYQESPNSLWIGTEGGGLYNYDETTNISIRYGLESGLPNEVIYAIESDNNNDNLWLSTNKGISRLNLKTKEFKNFLETDGLQGNEFNYGASLKTKNGNLVFGGINGFTVFDPNDIKEDTFIPPISITSFFVRDELFKIVTDSLKSISLEYNQNDFSFNFVALNYSQPNKNLYAYKLEGFDERWNYIGNNKNAVYTKLSAGDYMFMVKGSNSDGVWNENIRSIHIKISPPYWKTWWAYCIYVILLMTMFWLIYKFTLLRIQDRNELRRERLDREQMEEVNRLKLQLFTNISHDFRTPLTLILGPLKKIIREENLDNGYIKEQLTGMYRNATTLLQLINQLLDFRKSEAGKLRLQTYKYNIVFFLEDIKQSFEELALVQNINYTLQSSDSSIEVWFDKIEMKKVILNILSNAFKFTPKDGTISIMISKRENIIEIEIKDTGSGIRKEDLEFVFDRYFQLGQQNELRSGTGVGLALAKDIVHLHHGEISVESNLDEGSCFLVILPLGNSHFTPEEIIENDFENDSLDYYEVLNIKSAWIKEESNQKKVKHNQDLPSILLVEDNIEVRQFIKTIFENDFNVYESGNGEDGINSAQLNPIDIIVSDVMMPEMDGMEMCSKIKSDIRTSHIPVILLTARTSSKIQKVGYEKGADIYLTKPFDGETLKLQAKNILKSRRYLIDKFKKDILLSPKNITAISTDEIFLKKAMEIVENNLSDAEFNVNAFIDKMYMSQSVLFRKIKALTGMSISEFIRSIRLKKAGQLLTHTDMTITEISFYIGFNDLKYFRKCFKSAFNTTPSKYRKTNSLKP